MVAARGSQEVGFAQPLGEKFSLRSTSIYHRVAGRSGGLRFGSLYIFPTCYVNFVKKTQLTVQRTIFLKFYQITITNLDSDEINAGAAHQNTPILISIGARCTTL